ncbi:carboxylating nicotinate-nucleotide diphosphorylase [Flavilitoribacter nigricans]|uniref:Probable nicotinate-nucleotide pyrophosphorylase [carboxylating] n=1 Tax=Flavilitoribacter nigricans (strain ATCC 23147 / DSM 23189 / NBRC 102662 / NCIMB 1420 / SS-2) TaxID=1122177 RepID=A0A2D0NAJ8_FLAN2|nr:carboxylating nicotinate-nucleotide diphosphorylase [Flavilitoribacter nigricans]PHN04803.1 nicotinate-nucleotide diphosphorylase (carboxylating) [Flavilitoribacter nigricans DSM 23189 = NBRC 102662]
MDKETQQLLDTFIEQALAEDVGDGDHTSRACIPADAQSKAKLLVKDPGILAGVAVAERIFQKVDPAAKIDLHMEDGSAMSYGDIAFEVTCNSRALLMAERLVLNIMQRMSGIATLANRFHFEVEDLPVKILDTRKTTPLIRFLEKWAVRLGGCYNYRDGLYDWIMIKDNHIEACGGIHQAIEAVNQYLKAEKLDLGVTVEVRNLVELYEVLEIGQVTRIMLDNFEIPILNEAVAIVAGRFETEASGGINIHNVRRVAQSGVNYISVGALTHSATSLDLSLKIIE